MVEPAERPPENLRLLPPAVEQWLKRNGPAVGICLFLVAVTLAVYAQTLAFEFVSFDDNEYVYDNYHVKQGFTPASVKWAFTGVHSSNWHPLTLLSHILDWSLWGPWAGGHHLINVLLHAASSVVLFIALRRLTGATWRSGLVAALFCLHPAHVESVAWVSERKDVLSGLFFGLTLWAYAAYAEAAGSREQGAGSKTGAAFPWGKYALLLALFALGLLCKPMLVTVPFLLLLLDYWPLRRWTSAWPPAALILEKLPLLALSVASCVATYLVQRSVGAVTETIAPMIRVQTILLAYGRYLAKLIWPFGLAAPYPRDRDVYAAATLLSGLALAAVSAAALICCRQRGRYLLVGWFWFVGMLVPVIGLIVVGDQSMADRYTYLTYTGLFVALVWGAAEMVGVGEGEKRRGGERTSPAAPLPKVDGRVAWAVAFIVLVFFAVRSTQQTRVWKDSEALYRQALAVTRNNFMAHSNLGVVLNKQGNSREAEAEFQTALAIEPGDYQAHNGLGVMERRHGNLAAAIDHYLAALKEKPDFALAHSNLAAAYSDMRQPRQAEQECLLARKVRPRSGRSREQPRKRAGGTKPMDGVDPALSPCRRVGCGEAQHHVNLGIALFAIRSFKEGIAELEIAINQKPDDVGVRHELAKMYLTLDNLQGAFDQWKEVLTREPANAAAAKGFGIVLVKSGHGADAIPYLKVATSAAPQDLDARQYKVFAHIAAQQIPEAMAEYREVLKQDPKDRRVLKGLSQLAAAKPDDLCVRAFTAYALMATKQLSAATAEFRAVLAIAPNNLDALNSLAWIEAADPSAKLRNGKEAVAFAEKAAALRRITRRHSTRWPPPMRRKGGSRRRSRRRGRRNWRPRRPRVTRLLMVSPRGLSYMRRENPIATNRFVTKRKPRLREEDAYCRASSQCFTQQ